MSIIKSKESNKQDKQPAMPQQKLHINLTKNGFNTIRTTANKNT